MKVFVEGRVCLDRADEGTREDLGLSVSPYGVVTENILGRLKILPICKHFFCCVSCSTNHLYQQHYRMTLAHREAMDYESEVLLEAEKFKPLMDLSLYVKVFQVSL